MPDSMLDRSPSKVTVTKERRKRFYYTAPGPRILILNETDKTFLRENVIPAAYNGISPSMPKKNTTKETVAAAVPVRAAKPKTPRTVSAVETAPKPRVRTVKHSKATVVQVAAETAPVAVATPVNTHEIIAKIAYGYWEARSYQPGSPEQDWLRAEQEYLHRA